MAVAAWKRLFKDAGAGAGDGILRQQRTFDLAARNGLAVDV